MKRYFFGEGVYFFWKKEADIKVFFSRLIMVYKIVFGLLSSFFGSGLLTS